MNKQQVISSKHKARKRFGQNFLTDTKVIENIVSAIAPNFDDNLLEIGPGQGAMTLPLLECVKQLNVIEIDRDLIQILKSFDKDNLVINEGDALKFDLSTLPSPLRAIFRITYLHLFCFICFNTERKLLT